MSKFTTSALAGAIALFVSGAALADGVATSSNTPFAHEVTGGPTTGFPDAPRANATSMAFSVLPPDILIGRAAETGQVTVTITVAGAQILAAPTALDLTLQGTLQGSVTSGPNTLQFVILPPATADGGFDADLPIFSINALQLMNATALKTLGGSVTASVLVQDTTTGLTLSATQGAVPVLTSVQASESVNNGETTSTTIDVYEPSFKTQFANGATVTKLGTVTARQKDVDTTVAGTQVASTAGTQATTNSSGADLFVFDIAPTTGDRLRLTLNVPAADAFSSFYAVEGAGTACTDPAPGTAVSFAASTTSSTEYTAFAPITAPTGVTYSLCAVVDGETEIAAQTIGLTSQIDLRGPLTVDPPAVSTPAFHELRYNGTVANVDHFNPASNTSQISYLRIINPSTAGGMVHIRSTCDNGEVMPVVSRQLNAGQAVLLTAQQMANGAQGLSAPLQQCAVGKSRLQVTGEFDGMRVQNFLRNVTADGTQINTNVNTNDANTQGL